VPLWDGRAYYNLLARAVNSPFSLENYYPFGHASVLYYLLVGFFVKLAPGSVVAFQLAMTFVTCLGAYGFYQLLNHYTQGTRPLADPLTKALLTFSFAVHPLILGASFNFCLDHGLMCFFLLYYWFCISKNPIAAALAGTFMVFTKEPGVLLLPIPILAVLIESTARSRMRILKSMLAAAVVPLLFFGGSYVFRKYFQAGSAVWEQTSQKSLQETAAMYLNIFRWNSISITNLIHVFVLNFNWVLTVSFLAFTVLLGLRSKKRSLERNDWSLLFVLAGVTWALTRYETFTNARYVVPAVAILLLVTGIQGLRVLKSRRVQRVSAASLAVLLLLAGFRTFDPVSIAIFGTFPFGERSLLRVTSLTKECCGLGRDQLVYNLEYTKFHNLTSLALEKIQPSEKTFLLSHPLSTYFEYGHLMIGPLNPSNYHRSLGSEESLFPKQGFVASLVKFPDLPRRLYYLEFPIFDSQEDLAELSRLYSSHNTEVIQNDGYALRLHYFYN
jgi:hypothetical protein